MTCLVLTDEDFEEEVLDAPGFVVVNFCSDWSGAWHIMTPVMEQLAVELKGRAKVGRLDIEVGKRTATEYGIHSIPVTLIFNNGEVVDQMTGITSRHELIERFKALCIGKE